MTTLVEGTHAGEFIVSEGNGNISRESITVLSGENLVAGAVLGKVTASSKYVEHDPAGADGSENAIAVLFDAVDATAADAAGVAITRMAEVSGDDIVWITGISAGNKTDAIASLKTVDIIVRD